jgi:hypothetical protein
VKQLLRDDAAAVDQAIQRLVETGRVSVTAPEGGRTPILKPSTAVQSLVRDTWLARIGALNSFVSSLADAVYGRFIETSPRAFARTLNFLVREEDGKELERFFGETLVPFMTALDQRAAGGDGKAESFRLSICWAPYESMARGIEAREAEAKDDE